MIPPSSRCSHISFGEQDRVDACCFQCLGRSFARRQHLHLKVPEQLANVDTLVKFYPLPSESAGAPCPAPARGSHLGRLPSALQRESGSRLRVCEHFPAFCAGAHDSMASTVGRVRVLAIETVCTERAPRLPSSSCARRRQHVAEHGVAVPRQYIAF